MIEPEMAFYDLNDNMDLAEEFIKYTLAYILEKCEKDLLFLDQRLANEEKTKPQNQRSPLGLMEKIKFVVENKFKRVSYTEAIDILKNSKPNKKKIRLFGRRMNRLAEWLTLSGITIDYAKINVDEPDQKTVRAMDILPGIGEIVEDHKEKSDLRY